MKYKTKKNNIKKTSFLKILVNLFIILAVVTFFVYTAGISSGSDNTNEHKMITIESGDTLWRLVKEIYGSETNIRKMIYEIREMNDLENAELQPGQELYIPQNP